MGIFSKIKLILGDAIITAGMDQCINDFAFSTDELNSSTAPCFDQGYALQHVDALLHELGEENFCYMKNRIYHEYQIKFEGNVFDTFVFEHYARALQVVYRTKAQTNDRTKLSDFCNLLNNQDMAHQVGFFKKESGEYELIIHNIILFTPSIGSLDYLKFNLRQLVEYANKISKLDLPSTDEWKKSLPTNLDTKIKTAEEVLFPQDSDNIWKKYAKRIVLSENAKEIHFAPIRLVHDGVRIGFCDHYYIVDSKHIEDEKIIIYKDCPYIYTLQATISISINNLDCLRQGCNLWNNNTYFSLLTTTWKKTSDNDYRVTLRMNVLAAENGNTSTDTDIFVSYIKYIEDLYRQLLCQGNAKSLCTRRD